MNHVFKMLYHCEDDHHNHQHGHEHIAPIPTNANQSLYQYLDTSNIRCLNVEPRGRVDKLYKAFVKTQDNKYNCLSYLQSDSDDQMIVHVPLTANCKIYSIILRTNGNDPDNELNSPKTIKLFKNFTKNVDFDTLNDSKEDIKLTHPENVGINVDGSTTLNEDDNTFVEHYLPRHLFQNCSALTIYIENNWSGDEDELSRLFYLEIRGEFTGTLVSDNIVPLMTVYESAPNPVDHNKLESENIYIVIL